MARFALLRHDGPQGLHWDLLLEMDQTLKTWALPQPPESGLETTCKALPNHRPIYLEYEGPLSEGRGSVTRCDRGSYHLQHRSDSELVVELSGEKLQGRATLTRSPDDPRRWWFSFVAHPA